MAADAPWTHLPFEDLTCPNLAAHDLLEVHGGDLVVLYQDLIQMHSLTSAKADLVAAVQLGSALVEEKKTLCVVA